MKSRQEKKRNISRRKHLDMNYSRLLISSYASHKTEECLFKALSEEYKEESFEYKEEMKGAPWCLS